MINLLAYPASSLRVFQARFCADLELAWEHTLEDRFEDVRSHLGLLGQLPKSLDCVSFLMMDRKERLNRFLWYRHVKPAIKTELRRSATSVVDEEGRTTEEDMICWVYGTEPVNSSCQKPADWRVRVTSA